MCGVGVEAQPGKVAVTAIAVAVVVGATGRTERGEKGETETKGGIAVVGWEGGKNFRVRVGTMPAMGYTVEGRGGREGEDKAGLKGMM